MSNHKRQAKSLFLGTALLSTLITAPVSAMICSTDANVAIADGSGSATPGTAATIDIVVPANYEGTVTDMDFQLAIDHTWIGDLIVTLESPDNTVVTLLDRPGRPLINATFGCGNNNVDVTLDDGAGTLAEDQCSGTSPALGGTRQPTGTLADFNGDTIAGTWTLTVTDNAGQDLGTIISASNCIDASTNPVTISSFETRRRGKKLIADWQTSSEAFNLGFNLWGKIDGEWQQLNKRLISSRGFDSVEPQRYRRKINLLKIDGDVTEVGVSAFSTSGDEDFYGPFAIGEKYGAEAVPRYIDWASQRAAYDQAMHQAGYVKINNRWVAATKKRLRRDARQKSRFSDLTFSVKDEGVYRLTYEDLLGMGFDLKGMPVKKLAITRDGKAVPRMIKSDADNRRRFGPGAEIVFYAQGPDAVSARYIDTARYRVSLDSEKVLKAPLLNSESLDVTNNTTSSLHTDVITFGDKNSYSFIVPGEDPWYDSVLPAFGNIASKKINLTIPDTTALDQAAQVSLSFIGGVSFPRIDVDGDGEVEPNHHFKVYVNRETHSEAIFEGYSNGIDPVKLTIPVYEQLKHGENEIEFELIPDNGYNIDAVYYVGGSLEYTVPNAMNASSVGFAVEGDEALIQVSDPAEAVQAAYSVDGDGNFAQLALTQADGQTVFKSPQNSSLQSTPSVWLVGNGGYLVPTEVFETPKVDSDDLDLTEVDYVVVADPSLIGADLQRFVDRQAEMGRRTKVVNTQDIFNRYSDGLVVPQAIADYLAEQAQESPYKYVLLVGGHTYNYRGYNVSGDAPFNLIPSFYRGTQDFTQQIPTAVPFVDFDKDGSPDRAIGRWPVRDLVQLKNVVDKTLKWHADGSHKDSKTALFIADKKEKKNNFSGSLNRVIESVGMQYNPWQNTSSVDMDEINEDSNIDSGAKVTTARDRIVDAVNQGAALTVFTGHASPTRWGTQSMVTAAQADRFTNSDKPSLMIPLACYTTYYETPNIQSLSEVLFTGTDSGAVALSASSLLTKTGDSERFAKRLLEEMTVSGLDLGSAVLKVKQKNHNYSQRHQTIVYSWTTLGDPTLSFNLPDLTPLPSLNKPKK